MGTRSAKPPPPSRHYGSQTVLDSAKPLSNPRWEQFANDVLVMDQTAVYRKAFPSSRDSKPRHVWERASKLAAKVAPRVNYLRAQHSERLSVTPARVLERYAHIAFTDLPGIVRWRKIDEGLNEPVRILDFEKLTPAQRVAIKRKVSPPDNKGRQTIEIELHDPLKALEALAKHLGLFRNELAQVGTMNVQINLGAGREIDLGSDRPLALGKPPESTLTADVT